ncbi:unnamed protein product, partial [Symbiodinium necroappetens]
VALQALQNESSLSQADVEFQADRYANSSRGPRESRWKLWCAFAERCEVPPLPVTTDLIDKIGALFKQGRYRSAAQYYSVAKSEHRSQGYDWSPALDHAVAQAVRSITRRTGPSAAKLDFPLERIESPSDVGIVAAWFLLRGLEIGLSPKLRMHTAYAFGRTTQAAIGLWKAEAPFFGDGQGEVAVWPRQVVLRWAQHAFRVAGWGSAAICRYVQEAALADPTQVARAVVDRSAPWSQTAFEDKECLYITSGFRHCPLCFPDEAAVVSVLEPPELPKEASLTFREYFTTCSRTGVRYRLSWNRSGQESSSTVDTPPYLGAPTVVAGALQCSTDFRSPPVLSAIDHEGAYRSITVRDPHECGLLLPGDPPTLWSHFSFPFGSVGSVWGYLRVADVVSFLSIALLLMFAAHYVDDFFSIEQAATASRAFAAFQAFHRMLGFRMKEEKSKPPDRQQTLLGIEWSFQNQALFASPGEARIAKLSQTIRDYLQSDRMSASECAALTVKLCFTCTWVFNCV